MTAASNSTSARERAARAICRVRKLPADAVIDGAPLWERFLPEIDAILEAIGWEDQIQAASPAAPPQTESELTEFLPLA